MHICTSPCLSVHLHVSLCVVQARIECLIKYRREKIRSQRANVIRAWMTEEDMIQAKWSTLGPWETIEHLGMLP